MRLPSGSDQRFSSVLRLSLRVARLTDDIFPAHGEAEHGPQHSGCYILFASPASDFAKWAALSSLPKGDNSPMILAAGTAGINSQGSSGEIAGFGMFWSESPE